MKSIKKFTIFAGVNGAGKSTLFSTEAEDNLGIRLNSDEILHSLGLDWADSNAQILAGKQLLRLQKDCLEKGLSFNQETTLSGITILRTISQAKELGYSIHLRYVGVESPEIAKERVRKRIELGGHGVTGETIERRFIKSKENLLKIYPLCDTVIIYDNTISMISVATIINGKLEHTGSQVDWGASVARIASRLTSISHISTAVTRRGFLFFTPSVPLRDYFRRFHTIR